MQKLSRTNKIPWLIHSVNISAVLLVGGLLLLTAVARTSQLIVLVPVLGLLVVYWRLGKHPAVAAWYFAMALALLGWILLCEQIMTLDKVLGTHISPHLHLGVRLATSVLRTLPTENKREVEACCNDPLTWHYRPGSRYRNTFDCPTCNAPYEVTVDETGYLNQPLDPMPHPQHIDMFLAGDSVLQGMGVPSVVEWMRQRLPLHIWNLSIQAYGPRQKVNALLTYALPQSPQWLVVEFFAGNDLPEAIRDDMCQQGGDFRCRYHNLEVQRRFAHHPFYATIFDVRTDVWARVAEYSLENFTLATTRYLFDAMKGALKQRFATLLHAVPNRDATAQTPQPELPLRTKAPAPLQNTPLATTPFAIWPRPGLGSGPPAPVREGQWLAYVHAGLAVIQQQYERLVAALAGRAHPPTVILLYNPAPYEVYHGMGMELNPRAEQMFALQRETLHAFAQTHGWHFLDLTEPLHRVVRGGEVWLYGRYDQTHWSPQGTAIVADVLGNEILKVMRAD